MANEFAQWVAIGAILILTLGVFRQLSLLLPTTSSHEHIESGPTVGEAGPPELIRVARETLGDLGPIAVAFVDEACAGCRRLIADLTTGQQETNGMPILLIADRPSAAFERALQEASVPVAVDDGSVWRSCRVTATPMIVRLDEENLVRAKEISHRVDAVA